MPKKHYYTLTASCPDQVGIVARVGSQIVGLAHLVDDGGHADVSFTRNVGKRDFAGGFFHCDDH